jgi:UDPglucose 6-dehydrogenase
MNIAVFGTGYVGLVQGAVLADAGHQVVCVDIDESKLERLRRGEIPIFEPGLEPIVKANHAEGRLDFTSNAAQAIGAVIATGRTSPEVGVMINVTASARQLG